MTQGVYELDSHWKIKAEPHVVWAAIANAGTWDNWWPALLQARELEAGTQNGMSAKWRFVWRSRLLYRLSFDVEITGLEYPHKLDGRISGDLSGSGSWILQQVNGVCAVEHKWQVELRKSWMRSLEPVARRVFIWNHNAVMRQGELGLRRLLE